MPQIDFIALDSQGVITKEQWTATGYYCPRCGAKAPSVWARTDNPQTLIGHLQTRLFLCIRCHFTAYGLNGFGPDWDAEQRVEQIIKHGFA